MESGSNGHHINKSNLTIMMESKNDLYRSEWLELVFAGRNKAYGAYDLRQHNAFTTLKALFIGSALIIAGLIIPFIYSKLTFQDKIVRLVPEDEVLKITEYTAPAIFKDPEPTQAKSLKQDRMKIPILKFAPLKVVSAPDVRVEIPSLAELQVSAIGPETILGEPAAGVLNAIETEPSVNGLGVGDHPANNEPVGMGLLEKYPEFPGGHDAFNRYISRNLRYPMMARENNISGRVFVSFIIEKNGSLSNIQVVRGIGGGCDDEAIRVLRNSPSWTAGMQNGQKVRVAYTMPIFFQLAE